MRFAKLIGRMYLQGRSKRRQRMLGEWETVNAMRVGVVDVDGVGVCAKRA